MKPHNEILKLIREALQDEERAFTLAEKICSRAIAEETEGYESPISKQAAEVQLYLARQNLRAVFTNAESPIEKMFFGAFVLAALSYDVGVLMLGKVVNAPQHVRNYLETHRQAMEFFDRFRSSLKPTPTVKGFCDFLDWLVESGQMPPNERDALKAEVLSEGWIHDYFHVALQAGFPDIRINEKGARADAFIWIPSFTKFRLVVECDGWQWHGNKSSFTTDRLRDRVFQAEGYSVARYSGTEIFSDPFEAGVDLLEHIVLFRKNLENAETDI